MHDSVSTFLDQHKISLNEQQKEALERIDGKTLLLAVPGSGKTTVIIARLGYMIDALEIDPKRILTLTFSKLGVADLKKRYSEIFGKSAKTPQISTIHSFALSVIRTFQKEDSRHKVKVLEGKRSTIGTLFKRVMRRAANEADINDFERKLTLAKNLLLSNKEQETLFGEEYEVKIAYEEYKREHGYIDFDDMLIYAYRILKKNPSLLKRYRERFSYVQIDEAQDNSKIQDALIKLLIGEEGNLFMVADEDQSIYGFRGAYPEWILDFKKHYPEGEVIMMEENYRTTEALTQPAGEFILLNEGRYDKSMNAATKSGIPAEHRFFKTIDERDHYIIESVKREGKDTAVLYRNNDSAVELVDILEREGIPFNLRESSPTFFSSFLLRDLRDFYALAINPSDFRAFSRLWFKCEIQFSRANFDRFEENYHGGSVWKTLQSIPYPQWFKNKLEDLEELFESLAEATPSEFLETVYYEIGYAEYLDFITERVNDEQKLEQKRNVLETIAKRQKSTGAFFERLEELKEIMKRAQPKRKRSKLTLSTIHGAKGLEFEKVLLVDVNKDILPAAGSGEESENSFQEEVRLFYVGVTRAKTELEFLSVGTPKWQPRGHEVSPFIELYFNPAKIKKMLASKK